MARLALALAATAALLCLLSSVVHAQQCKDVVDDYMQEMSKDPIPYDGDNLLYFLHVPRTAGRSFHSCFVLAGTPPRKRCPKSYDQLRVSFEVPNCQLLSSHDDFSIVPLLPQEVSVFTQLRDPVDRFFSSYEFAVEHAAAMRDGDYLKYKRGSSTEDVWPWEILIPFFVYNINARAEEDMRMTPRKGGNWVEVTAPDGDIFFYNSVLRQSKWELTEEERNRLLPPIDPYNNSMVMPVHEFMNHHVAREVVHNGQFYQILGITNYSHYARHVELRDCLEKDHELRKQLLEVAIERINKFAHVGITDKLYESVLSAAGSLNLSLTGPSYVAGEGPRGRARGEMSIKDDPLGVDFLKCTQTAQIRNNRRRVQMSLGMQMKNGQRVQFSREMRKNIPEEVIAKIRELNAEDMALYNHASSLLQQRLEDMRKAGTLGKLPDVTVDPDTVSTDLPGPKPKPFRIPKPGEAFSEHVEL